LKVRFGFDGREFFKRMALAREENKEEKKRPLSWMKITDGWRMRTVALRNMGDS